LIAKIIASNHYNQEFAPRKMKFNDELLEGSDGELKLGLKREWQSSMTVLYRLL
jgi:hypothetical protein